MISSTFQARTDTSYDRYPEIFEEVSRIASDRLARRIRVLSFGCSSGEECLVLRKKYFPKSADIFGVDVNIRKLYAARLRTFLCRNTKIRFGSDRFYKRNAPFDVIFAMSVLCSWPATEVLDSCVDQFAFRHFERATRFLDSILSPGGLLVIYNANFRFVDADVYLEYSPVGQPRESGFVHKFGRDNLRLPGESPYKDVIFKKSRV